MPKDIIDKLEEHTFILLEQGKLSLIGLNKDKFLATSQTIPWEAKTLSQALSKVSESVDSDSVSIVLGDNLAFLTPVLIKKSQEDIKQAILDKAEEKISIPLEELGVDWLQVSETEKHFVYQIFAVQKSLLSLLGRAAQQASLSVDSVEPLAFLLGYIYQSKTPTLVAWEGTHTTLVLIHKGKVIASAITKPDKVYNSIESLISFSQDNLSTKPTNIIMASSSKHLTKKKLDKFDLEVFSSSKNPLNDKRSYNKLFPSGDDSDQELELGIGSIDGDTETEDVADADEKEFELETGSDSDSDNIDESVKDDDAPQVKDLDISPKAPKLPLRVTEGANMDETVTPKPEKSKPKIKIIIVALTVIAILVGIVVGGVLVYQNALKSANEPIQEEQTLPDNDLLEDTTMESSDEAMAGTESADLSDDTTDEAGAEDTDSESTTEVSIQILNGSGTPGAAGKAADVLEAADFTDIDTGNADSYDYAATQISVKSGQTELLDQLESALSSEYNIGETDEDLAASSDFDAVIIVGQE